MRQGASLRMAITNKIADVYVAEKKNGRTLSFGDGLDVMARAIQNALDAEMEKLPSTSRGLLEASEKQGMKKLTWALNFALETPSSFVQHEVETRELNDKEIQR